MALSRFPLAISENANAVLDVARTIRQIRDGAGNLTFTDLDRLQTGLERAKVTFLTAMAEAAKSPAAAQAFMAGMNGPATLTEYQALAQDIEIAASAWNARLSAALASVPTGDLIRLVTRSPSQTRHIERVTVLGADLADPLRQSAELTALLASFEAVGA